MKVKIIAAFLTLLFLGILVGVAWAAVKYPFVTGIMLLGIVFSAVVIKVIYIVYKTIHDDLEKIIR